MSQGTACKCQPRAVVVTGRRCNYSAFSGYRMTPSAYSEVVCLACGARWRTKAAFVSRAPDADHDLDPRFAENRKKEAARLGWKIEIKDHR